jgi:hypothetical protein
VADLKPSEDYKTSILSGLSPTIIMECASRALAFHSYQAAQEIIYQEHLAKGLTEKYNTLSHQMDQLIHDANSQIKVLQDKVQGQLVSNTCSVVLADLSKVQQADQVDLIAKNGELGTQLKEKARLHEQLKRTYETLRRQQMQPHLAVAAGDEAEITLRGHRQMDRIPGVHRSGTDVYSHQSGSGQRSGALHPHNRQGSGSSASSGQRGGFGMGMGPVPTHASHVQNRGHGLRSQTHTGRKLVLVQY